MKPYYEDGSATIYLGDSRELLAEIGHVDLVVTDPPYAINADGNQKKRAGIKAGKAKAASKDYGTTSWDIKPPSRGELDAIIAAGDHAIIWGGNYFGLPGSPGWLVWDKDNGSNHYADCELAWTNLQQAVRKIRFRWQGMLQEHGGRNKEPRFHPTQKPLPVMSWAIRQAPDTVALVLDPYAGSGSTLRAAKDLGIKSVGIEIEERYCEIAANRLRQETLF